MARVRRFSPWWCACSVALALIAGLPAAAQATWSEPLTLSTAGMQASVPTVAMNRGNVTAATWTESPDSSVNYTSDFHVFAGVAEPGGAFKVSSLGVGISSNVAVGPHGEVLVVLVDKARNEIRAVFRPGGGSFGTPRVLEAF